MALETKGTEEEPWDRFFRYPAISFTHNAELRKLFETVLDDSTRITLVLGAGVSLDAGFPSWQRLILNMSEIIDTRWRDIIKADASDPMRKAEYVIRMAIEASHHHEGQVVTDALYGGAKTSKSGGLLADAIARFAAMMGDRLDIVTTNFDLLVEEKLKDYVPADKVHEHSLDEWEARIDGDIVGADGEHHILHVHGILEPNRLPREPVILTESAFLEHGDRVRKEVAQRLQDSCVIFIGVSLTDPNLIGPLWALKSSETPHQRPFSVTVAAPEITSNDDGNSQAFAIKQASLLADHLGLDAVHLKSYAQVAQVFHELSLAVKTGTYLDEADTSTRYGNRLQSVLEVCHSNISCAADEDIPSGTAAFDLSKRLFDALYGPAGLVESLNQVAAKGRTANNPNIKEMFAAHEADLAKERFGLFLWLRSRGGGGHEAEYQLNLVGTSVYTHLEPWSLDRHASISLRSRHAVARAAFLGQTQQQNIDDSRDWQLWRGLVAVPFHVKGLTNSASINTVAPDSGGEPLDVLAVGGITLNTTNAVTRDSDSINPRSIISMLPWSTDEALTAELARIAQEIVSPAGPRTV